jgi:hypothetical protein
MRFKDDGPRQTATKSNVGALVNIRTPIYQNI